MKRAADGSFAPISWDDALSEIGAKVQEIIAEAGPEALLELREDHGGNTVIRRHEADLLLLEVPAEELHDVDTAQALEELKAEEQV